MIGIMVNAMVDGRECNGTVKHGSSGSPPAVQAVLAVDGPMGRICHLAQAPDRKSMVSLGLIPFRRFTWFLTC